MRNRIKHAGLIHIGATQDDAEYAGSASIVDEWVQEPTTRPWCNQSILFRDPDGNLINLFTPDTNAAIARFEGR